MTTADNGTGAPLSLYSQNVIKFSMIGLPMLSLLVALYLNYLLPLTREKTKVIREILVKRQASVGENDMLLTELKESGESMSELIFCVCV